MTTDQLEQAIRRATIKQDMRAWWDEWDKAIMTGVERGPSDFIEVMTELSESAARMAQIREDPEPEDKPN